MSLRVLASSGLKLRVQSPGDCVGQAAALLVCPQKVKKCRAKGRDLEAVSKAIHKHFTFLSLSCASLQ